ncbi:MAG: hypothetical protein JXP73_10545 [Deltaproteobacteria bacterium]|nr:hypothetical protein [Deltaproteobacteria bacterium]
MGGADAGQDVAASGGTSLASGGGGAGRGGGGGGGTTGSRSSSSGGVPSSSGGVPSSSGGVPSSTGGAGRTGTGGSPGSGGAAGGTGAPPETRDGGAGEAGAPVDPDGLLDYCEAWTRAVCAIEVECCQARGFEASVEWCPVPARPTSFVLQPSCTGKLVTPDDFDAAAARACVDLQPQLFAGCRLARRDSDAYAAAMASCAQVAPPDLLEPGQICYTNLPCAAPPGMVSVCYYEPGSGGIGECSEPVIPPGEGEPCEAAIGCAPDLVCGTAGTCTSPLADGEPCWAAAQCSSGYCDSVCAEPPPIPDSRCETLQQLAKYALYMNVGNGSRVTATETRLVWLGYYGPRGEILHHAPKDGRGPVVHLTPEAVHHSTNVDLVADDDYVYDIDNGVVGRVSLADGSRAALADVGFDGTLAAKRGDDLVIVADYCNRMARVSAASGAVALHPGQHATNRDSQTPQAAADDDAVYCANGRRITRFGDDGGFAVITEEAVSSIGWTTGIQALGGKLYYWASGDSVEDKGLLRILDPGTGQITLVTPPSAPLTMMAADPAKGLLLWGTEDGIQQYAPGSGASVLAEPPVPVGRQVALDEAYFYWIHEDGIYRWPRP